MLRIFGKESVKMMTHWTVGQVRVENIKKLFPSAFMLIFETVSKRGVKILLTSERWNHIVMRHPETEEYFEDIKEVLQNPSLLVQNAFDRAIIFYHKYYKEEKLYLVIVVEEEKGFILTAYTTNSPKQGERL